MKKLNLLLVSAFALCMLFTGCEKTSTVTDIDGNVYKTVIIEGQEWMAENLKTTKYDNGDPVPEVSDNTQWSSLTTGAWSYYNNDEKYNDRYGKLYNWYAADDSRNVCPAGWHVPSDEEWTVLTDYLGGESVAGGKMKTRGTIQTGTGLWQRPNTDADNSSGFAGIPGGYRFGSGGFSFVGEKGCWWSTTIPAIRPERGVWGRYLNYNNGTVFRGHGPVLSGFSVRCVRD
ncbi:MAG: fibrobacter succinogenes major paralogous domain-containing protein [Proteobacteria bacterium]|nr:fibrobacter succinogenes major paralogous domain-containing protein [Pseudomonadota bacterium]